MQCVVGTADTAAVGQPYCSMKGIEGVPAEQENSKLVIIHSKIHVKTASIRPPSWPLGHTYIKIQLCVLRRIVVRDPNVPRRWWLLLIPWHPTELQVH